MAIHLTEDLLSLATSRPIFSASIFLFCILVATRTVTGYRFWKALHSNAQHHSLPILPYWIPYLGTPFVSPIVYCKLKDASRTCYSVRLTVPDIHCRGQVRIVVLSC